MLQHLGDPSECPHTSFPRHGYLEHSPAGLEAAGQETREMRKKWWQLVAPTIGLSTGVWAPGEGQGVPSL